MPWHISNRHDDCAGYAVVKDDDNEVVGCHKTKQEAEDQMAALYASENVRKSLWGGAFDPNHISSFEE